MNRCLEESDLLEMGDQMIADFDRRIAQIPEDMCGPFHAEARDLETQLLTIYKLVVTVVRKIEDLAQVADLWSGMVKMCDHVGRRLGELVKRHPACGAEAYYDRVLDLRNKCLRLQQMHS